MADQSSVTVAGITIDPLLLLNTGIVIKYDQESGTLVIQVL